MKLPFLVSVPHAGLNVPPEVRDICILTPEEIYADSDGGAAEIYHDLQGAAAASCSADIARAIVDLNRAPDNFGKDGVIKTHTCFIAQVYRKFPSQIIIEKLLSSYYYPYHRKLEHFTAGTNIRLGIDCHTMAVIGPPIAPDPGKARPLVCLSNADFTCPDRWLANLATCFREVFPREQIQIHAPFKGGYIIRNHSARLPWLQIEISRTDRYSDKEKNDGVFNALSSWNSMTFK